MPKDYLRWQVPITNLAQPPAAIMQQQALVMQQQALINALASTHSALPKIPEMITSMSAGLASAAASISACTNLLYSNALTVPPFMSELQAQLTRICHLSLESLGAASYAQALSSVSASLNSFTTSLASMDLDFGVSSPSAGVSASIQKALDLSIPHIPEEQVQEYTDAVTPVLKCKRLTLSDLISLINLLVAILFGIISSLPSEQANHIIVQNETIIDQQAEIIQLSEENAALCDAMYALTDSINLLSDEFELLREESERAKDASELECQHDTADGQEQNCDTLN